MRHIEYHRQSSGHGFSPQAMQGSAARHARDIDKTRCLLARARELADPVQRRSLELQAEMRLSDLRRSATVLARIIKRMQKPGYETRTR
jgi:hypothetical protein